MSTVDRREFLRSVAKYGGGAAMFAPSLAGLAACNDVGRSSPLAPGTEKMVRTAARGFGGYGPLSVSPDCPELLIPEGFTCVKLSETLAPSQADPSFLVPQAFDGMAAFAAPDGNVRLVRNHEIRDPVATARPIGANPYDVRAGGGTTTLEVRVLRGDDGGVRGVKLEKEFVSLSGTHVNCAGGPTPWGSWLSCEETTEGAPQGRAREHGYVFEVPADATVPVDPVPLREMGRFVHEAVAMDPATGFVYETEDFRYEPGNEARPGSGFYRFVPRQHGDLTRGGRLQMLAVRGRPQYDTTTGQRPGMVLPVEWVDIEDPDPANAATDPSAVFRQGLRKGGAIFQRLEGCWYGDGSIFFNATSGGDAGAGQVWQYRPLGPRQSQLHGSGGQLILVFESPSFQVMDSPDNICVSPRGGLVVCEDGGGVQFIRGLTQRGDVFDFVRTNGELPEFCGATFSPDGGRILFLNIQGSTSSTGTARGGTYAIWGPWEEGAL